MFNVWMTLLIILLVLVVGGFLLLYGALRLLAFLAGVEVHPKETKPQRTPRIS